MKIKSLTVIPFNVFLVFLLLFLTVEAGVQSYLYAQALSISCKTPDVILQPSIAGTSEVYVNDTSARVSVTAPLNWWNSSWRFRRPISINNTQNNNVLLDYQIFINVTYDGDMKADFSDLRFTWHNASVNVEQGISYWIQDKVDSAYAEVWVKVPEILNNTYYSEINTTLHMYYGNPSASSASNGDDTFEFFDDFDDGMIDTDKWTAPGCEETGGELIINESADNGEYLQSTNIFGPGNATKFRAWYTSGTNFLEMGFSETPFTIPQMGDDAAEVFEAYTDPTLRGTSEDDAGNMEVTPIGDYSDSYHAYDILWKSDEAKFYIDGDLEVTHTTALCDLLVPFTASHPYAGGLREVRLDWVFVRKYASPEPIANLGAEETISYDYVLKIVNQVTDNWKVNLEVCSSSNIGRLSNLTISFHDGSTSDQIIINNGIITQSVGPQHDLLSSVTIYISISNLQATNSEISYLYVYLEILAPNTSTYNLFIITFEIT